MDFWKKWFHIAVVFVLMLSLLSPAAVMAQADGVIETVQPNKITKEEVSFDDEAINNFEQDISNVTETELSPITTLDSATVQYSEPKGYVTVSIEKFTLGQGYIKEPIQVPFYEGDNVAKVLVNLLGDGNYNNTGSVDNAFYLASVYDPNPGEEKVPQYILKESGPIDARKDSDWLGQFEYTSMSGWMVSVNNNFISVGTSDWFPEDGDVIRWQFTIWGYGADLGGGFGGNNFIIPANKDELTTKIAEINNDPNKNEILANPNVQTAYVAAYEKLMNMESSQESVDSAFSKLNDALDGKEEVVESDKKALKEAIEKAEVSKASVKVSVDGKNVDLTEYWVTQYEFDEYVDVILSAQQLIADETAIQDDIDAKVLALDQATEAFDIAKKEGIKSETAVESDVKFTVAPKTVTLKLYDENNHEVTIGDGVEGTYKVYTTKLQAGDYRYEGFDSDSKSVGGGKLTVTTEANQEYQFRQLNFNASNKDWKVGEDYTIKVGQDTSDDTSLKLGDETTNGQTPVLGIAGKPYFYTFEPASKHTGYNPLSDSITVTIGTSAQSISKVIPFSGNVTFTVPQEAELFVGRKIKHFIEFKEIKPESEAVINTNGTKTYSFKLVNNGSYNYRVSQEGKLTNTGTFTANAQNAALEITKEQLEIQSPQAILNKDTYLEGNIYLNINEQNHLKLNQGDSFKLLPLRSWQALIEGINNYFFEPDFHYEIITGNDVVEIEPGKPGSYATVNALKNGTAIVQVTYDALKVNGSAYINGANDAFSAIWPENVGLFVVTVGQGETGITTGIESNKERNQKANEGKTGNLQNGVFDADIDSVYFVEDEPGAYFTFTPTAGSSVSVLRPEINHGAGTVSYGAATFSTKDVTSNDDGSFTALFTEGRNIVKVENGGKAEYHVVTARPLNVTIENLTKPNEQVSPGDKVKVTFKGLSFPANKLAGIYNFNAQLNFIGGPEQQLIAGLKRQYNITTQANDVTFTIPENHKGEYILEEGHIKLGFFGSPMGDHRNIDPIKGANPNFNAEEREGYYSIFPTITIIDEPIVEVDKSVLKTTIEEAEKNKVSVKISIDGKDVEPKDKWVTQAELDAYANAIKSAQDLIADENAIQDAVNAKVLALNQSTEKFNEAKKAGTKSSVTTPTQQAYNTVGKYMVERLPNPKFGDEWWIITLARGGYEVPSGYYGTYYKNVVDYVVSKGGELDKRRYTEYSRLIIALTAIGKDPTNVGGYNLVEKLSDFDKVVWQGVNGAYYGLIALNTWDFELPNTATTTKQKLVDFILSKQLADGGWDLSNRSVDPDMTGMAIQSLAPYYNSQPKVKAAIDQALTTLSKIQLPNGGYQSWGTENVESATQVVAALISIGIDPKMDARFNQVLPNIMTYYSESDGGFKHIKSETKANGMATEQVGYTLAAYHRLLNGDTALYDMSDTKLGETPKPEEPKPEEPKPEEPKPEQPKPEVPKPEQPNGIYGYSSYSIVISSSEVPLTTTAIEFYEGESVFDVLKRATAHHGIPLSYRETQYGTYIDGINGLYEFDRGPLSGWMYRVNGVFPAFSAALYTLQPGDRVEWLYTLDLGKDVGGYVDDIENDKPKEELGKENIESKKDNEKKEQIGEDKEIKVPVEENVDHLQAKITNEQLSSEDKQLLIQHQNGTKVEFPSTAIKLAEDEIAFISVEQTDRMIDIQLSALTKDSATKNITLGKAYAKVTIPTPQVTANMVVLQEVNGEYRAVPHQIVNGEIILFVKTGGSFVLMEESITFKDIQNLANQEEVEFLASRHVIKGKGDGIFAPNEPVTRGQFAAMISRALGLQAQGSLKFTDTQGSWYENDIQALFEAGITNGKTASTFAPNAEMSRQEAAAFMSRILEYVNYETEAGQVNFKDAENINEEFKKAIAILNQLDIMTGKDDGTFDANGNLTRIQMAKILKRTLNTAGLM